jgi:hypothetical protein
MEIVSSPWEMNQIKAQIEKNEFIQEAKKVANREKKVKFMVDIYINDDYVIADCINGVPGSKDIRGILCDVKVWKNIEELKEFLQDYVNRVVKAVEKALKEG